MATLRYPSSGDDSRSALYTLLSPRENDDSEMDVRIGDDSGPHATSLLPILPCGGPVPSSHEPLACGGERFLLILDGHPVVVHCELQPKPRLRALLDGAVRRETGAVSRGLRIRLMGRYTLACEYRRFILGSGLCVSVNCRPVAHSFGDPDVLLAKARSPAMALALCLSLQTLFLVLTGDFWSWQWVAATLALAVCLVAAGGWEWWPEGGYWATLFVAGLEMVGAGTSLATSWALAQQMPPWLAWSSLGLFVAKVGLLYLMIRCMP